MRKIWLLFTCLSVSLAAYDYNPEVNPAVWEALSPYFLPENHPIKPTLDKMAQKRRFIESKKMLKHVRFKIIHEGEKSQAYIATHKDMKGYIFKIYTDYGLGIDDWKKWLSRIEGANGIRESIETYGLGDNFKVPKKWVYPLPVTPRPLEGHKAKHFILVVEDMHLMKSKTSKKRWKSEFMTPEILNGYYAILSDNGLSECIELEKVPFSEDGRICFIDAEMHAQQSVDYKAVLKFLSKEMGKYWKTLIKK